MIRIHAGWGRAVALSFIILNSSFCLWAQGQSYGVVSRGPDLKVWQKTVVENGVTNVHSYTELATGLNYTNEYGQLVDADETISILPNGGAIANHGRHTVSFPGDIGAGVLQVITPDGRQLQSRPYGVCYDDGSNTVCIATITNAIGYLTSSNQVTYRNAFSGLDADLVCTYRKGGFECDLVFRQQPPTPDQFGLDASFSTVELVTEFFNTEDPQQIPAASDDYYGLQDYSLVFGKLKMTHGKAFAFRGTNSPTQNNVTPVYKHWMKVGDRRFLVESVPLLNIADNLNALPLQSSIAKPDSKLKYASNHPVFPPSPGILACTNRILLAAADFKHEPGVVLDYNTIDDDQGDYTFQTGQTYYITGPINFGNVTLEGGTVIKFSQNSTCLAVNGSLTCPSDPDHPAMLTAQDDCTVGENLGMGSSPSGTYANIALYFPYDRCPNLQNIRINYAAQAILAMSSAAQFTDCQFLNCNQVFTESEDDWEMDLEFDNCLFGNTGSALMTTIDYENGYNTLTLHHCTVDSCGVLADNSWAYTLVKIYSYGSIFSNCGWWAFDWSTLSWSPYSDFGSSSHNGYYGWESGSPLPGEDTPITGTSYPFKSAGNANYYLADNTFRDIAGTINVDNPTNVTTYTPQDGGFPDTNTPDLGYHYQINEDSDFDGIPDWWIYQYFGNYNYNGTNLDANGNTLLYDYTNGLDPNPVQFTVAVTNNYVNMTNVCLNLNVTAGVPAWYTVQMDNTNFQATTNWTSMASTNITAYLGSIEGWHELWIGLKGSVTNATVDWQWKRLKLDLTPPLIVVTNPAVAGGAATLHLPLVQVQGYGSEALSRFTYDLSNAVTMTTNQLVEILSQDYGTNTSEFTTNYFQATDVLLTNGVNLLTFHAADLAGNTTNFSCELDFTPKTNAPVVQLLWPTNGMKICGSNLVCHGTVDDPSANVTMQLLDANGHTSFANVLVGRDGLFYSGNLILASGTNSLTCTVTDSSGLTTTTNITVSTSDLGLTVGSVTAGQTLVTGTIDDNSYTVYVNGVIATNDGSGHWSTIIPPVGVGGGAVVVNAVKTGDNVVLQQPVPAPQGVFISQYHSHKYFNTDFIYDLYETNHWWVLDWQAGAGGLYNEGVDETLEDVQNWPASQWPASLPEGVEQYQSEGQWTTNTTSGPNLAYEHCDGLDWYTYSSGYWFSTRRTADTEMKLATGGPLGLKQKMLWCITVSATDQDTGLPIPPGQIQVDDQTLGADGKLWRMYAGNEVVDVTPRVNAANYSITIRGAGASPTVTANGVDPSLWTSQFCVGQSISLGVSGPWPDGVDTSKTVYQWQLNQGTYVNDSTNAVSGANSTNGSVNWFPNPNLLTVTNNATITAWWVSGGSPALYRVGATCILFDTNGNQVGNPSTQPTSLQVIQPLPTFSAQIVGSVAVDNNYAPHPGTCELHFGIGNDLTNCGIKFTITNVPSQQVPIVQPPVNVAYGQYFIVQLADVQLKKNLASAGVTNGLFCNTNGLDTLPELNGLIMPSTELSENWSDQPGSPLEDPIQWYSESDSFTNYLMFQPTENNANNKPLANSIAVPMYLITWNWSGVAKQTNDLPLQYELVSSNANCSGVSPTTTFPLWTQIVNGPAIQWQTNSSPY